jgi:hypothetical protein
MDAAPLRGAGLAPVALPIVALATVLALLVLRPGAVIEVSLADFVVITLLVGGWLGWRAGRAIAHGWRPYWHVVAAMVPFALVVRWAHYALFHGTLLSWQHYLVDLAVVLSLATLGYRAVRAAQMTRQYRWLYEQTGPFSWRRAG